MVDRKLVASGLYESLENASIEFRWTMPELFHQVDVILATPGRAAQRPATIEVDSTAFRLDECDWCGDRFVATHGNGRWTECCCQGCAVSLWRFQKRRAG